MEEINIKEENNIEPKLDSNEPKLDSKGRAYATVKRKNYTARVWIKKGNGEIKVNGRTITKYFARPVLRMVINQPFESIKSENNFDISSSVLK